MSFASWIDQVVSWFVRRDPLKRAGEIAAAEAERMWQLDIIDPPKGATSEQAKRSLIVINEILAASGWAWAGPYKGNGPPQWCGLFAATCWRRAGLDPKWLATFWASTLRLSYWIRYKAWNGTSAGKRPEAGARMVISVDRDTRPEDLVFADGSAPRRGDIVIVGDGTPTEGDHITVLTAFDAVSGVFTTISGNGGGVGPRGDRREGVSLRDYVARPASGYRVLWVMRPGAEDLEAG